MSPLHVRGLDRFVDVIHAQFDAWTDGGDLDAAIGPDGVALLRLAVHEWVANLVQHAEFCGQAELTLALEVIENGIRCEIEDSSRGFDFVSQVGEQQSILEEPAPSERGRGLLMLVSCAEDLAFQTADDEAPQRVAFTVRAPDDEMFASLFRPEDLVLDSPPLDSPPLDTRGDGATTEATPAPLSAPSGPPSS